MKEGLRMQNEVTAGRNTDEKVIRAAYALNMCTVSVSQIVDYNDSYILEQEYEAILNNLNLEQMPKDEALLNVLTELLNTITFFRIQEIKKAQIEKEYQQKVKNAIWSAVPNVSVFITAGASVLVEGPLALLSVAATVGSAYMNYRKEKSNALTEKEKSEVELQITAIEQFNALRRELFTTAWRLADTYGFPDEYRLTERQIKQYNEILMDQDEYRKYARLEYIQNKFEAYPPFWYFFGHTAHYIAEQNLPDVNDSEEEAGEKALLRKEYLEKAKSHLAHFAKLNAFSVLREDQMASSAMLEYADILMLEEKRDIFAINQMIKDALKHAGNSFDLLQMCAVAYLKTGEMSAAAPILRMLVNEDYNAVMNAKILSRIYVEGYVRSKDMNAWSDYQILKTRIAPEYLFPMPESTISDNTSEYLEQKFVSRQKILLFSAFSDTLEAFYRKAAENFYKVLPAPFEIEIHMGNSQLNFDRELWIKKAKELHKKDKDGMWREYTDELASVGYCSDYIDILNETLVALEDITIIKADRNGSMLVPMDEWESMQYDIKNRIFDKRKEMIEYQEKMDEGRLSADDYANILENLDYQYFMGNFYTMLKKSIKRNIDNALNLSDIEVMENGLFEFCDKNELPLPFSSTKENIKGKNIGLRRVYITGEVLGEGYIQEKEAKDEIRRKLELVKNALYDIVPDENKSTTLRVYLRGNDDFREYFRKSKLRNVEDKALAVFDDDRSFFEMDLVLCTNGFIITKSGKGTIAQDTYEAATIEWTSAEHTLKLGGQSFNHPSINNDKLYELMRILIK